MFEVGQRVQIISKNAGKSLDRVLEIYGDEFDFTGVIVDSDDPNCFGVRYDCQERGVHDFYLLEDLLLYRSHREEVDEMIQEIINEI